MALYDAESLSRLKLISASTLRSQQVYVNKYRNSEEKCLDVLPGDGVARRHFTNRVLPTCLIYRNPEGEASCSVHLSTSPQRNYSAMSRIV